jgi:hypothetical protein
MAGIGEPMVPNRDMAGCFRKYLPWYKITVNTTCDLIQLRCEAFGAHYGVNMLKSLVVRPVATNTSVPFFEQIKMDWKKLHKILLKLKPSVFVVFYSVRILLGAWNLHIKDS